MELQDFLSKLSLPQDFTRRGFLNLKVVERPHETLLGVGLSN